MGKNTIDLRGNDIPALEYIKSRGYASYSSMVNVRDKKEPQPFVETPYFKFGKELHSRFLEHKKLETLSEEEEEQLKAMVNNLADNALVVKIMRDAACEVEFKKEVNGLVTYGRIDIKTFAVADLKTTRLTNPKQFAAAMDFLQAALYTRVTGLKDFYYIGISKVKPYSVMVFNVAQYPDRLKKANEELDKLTVYIRDYLKKEK